MRLSLRGQRLVHGSPLLRAELVQLHPGVPTCPHSHLLLGSVGGWDLRSGAPLPFTWNPSSRVGVLCCGVGVIPLAPKVEAGTQMCSPDSTQRGRVGIRLQGRQGQGHEDVDLF